MIWHFQSVLAREARKLKGKPYKLEAKLSDAPEIFSCSSLTRYLYRKVGVELPILSIHQALCGIELFRPWQFESGDLLFFKGVHPHRGDLLFPGREINIGHVAMNLGDGKIIEARFKKRRVAVVKLSPRRESEVLMARRILRLDKH